MLITRWKMGLETFSKNQIVGFSLYLMLKKSFPTYWLRKNNGNRKIVQKLKKCRLWAIFKGDYLVKEVLAYFSLKGMAFIFKMSRAIPFYLFPNRRYLILTQGYFKSPIVRRGRINHTDEEQYPKMVFSVYNWYHFTCLGP